MHHAVVRQIHAMASEALLNAVLEPPVPSAGSARLRADIAVDNVAGQGCTTFLDVAVTCPTQPSYVAVAASGPGAAAAAYADRVKEPRYGPAVEALNAGRASLRYAFRPLVVDTIGAWDPRALDVFRRIASAWGRRAGSRPIFRDAGADAPRLLCRCPWRRPHPAVFGRARLAAP
jgi:hypothetical protein